MSNFGFWSTNWRMRQLFKISPVGRLVLNMNLFWIIHRIPRKAILFNIKNQIWWNCNKNTKRSCKTEFSLRFPDKNLTITFRNVSYTVIFSRQIPAFFQTRICYNKDALTKSPDSAFHASPKAFSRRALVIEKFQRIKIRQATVILPGENEKSYLFPGGSDWMQLEIQNRCIKHVILAKPSKLPRNAKEIR